MDLAEQSLLRPPRRRTLHCGSRAELAGLSECRRTDESTWREHLEGGESGNKSVSAAGLNGCWRCEADMEPEQSKAGPDYLARSPETGACSGSD